MISEEPRLRVGLMERQNEVHGILTGKFDVNGEPFSGPLTVKKQDGALIVRAGNRKVRGQEIIARGSKESRFTVRDVTIGIQFHWERKEDQTFRGNLCFIPDEAGVTVLNEVGVEDYLKSVISSEMSAESPAELLKAHAVTSRSWLVAMLEREKRQRAHSGGPVRGRQTAGEIVRWYDREDHASFDVCADDHCQRYQGVTRIISEAAAEAVDATRGVFLVSGGEICDARFSKSCGGRTELFESAWEDVSVPYLQSVPDAEADIPAAATEEAAHTLILGSPEVSCNTGDASVLKTILPSYDQETADFFRWTVEYTQEELRALLRKKSGIDFGVIRDLVPLTRGPSGRIVRLEIVGSEKTIVVGKELEIRKWFSPSHLYSSAFVPRGEGELGGAPARWVLHGAGWGHGVGLCQIGAAVMAMRGKRADEILRHYFRGAELKTLY